MQVSQQSKPSESAYSTWTTDQLVRATTIAREDYLDDAVEGMLQELERRGVTPGERQALENEAARAKVGEIRAVTGVRGFLVFFLAVVALNTLTALASGIRLMAAGAPLAAVLAIPIIGVSVYGGFAFVLLITRRPDAPRHARNWLIATFLVNLMVALIIRTMIGYLLFQSMGALVWIAYLSQSKRVAATYQSSG